MRKLYNVLVNKECYKIPPIWIMRQAGRYLPEYLATRSKINNFLDLCYNPQLACEVTLQPIRRFDFDSAIIFSDILVIPDALGIKVDFIKNHGPKLAEFDINKDLAKLKITHINQNLDRVYEAVSLTRSKLQSDKDLIGFCGAPWTLACYMIEGGGSKNFDKVREVAIKNSELFAELILILTDSLKLYLSSQIKAGASVVKIFDSWAGILPPEQIQKWVINPAREIVDFIKQNHPKTPVIYFPKSIGVNYQTFAKQVDSDGLAIDQNIDKLWAQDVLQNSLNKVIQGNLDNFLLAFGDKKQIEDEVKNILNSFANKPFIFNLGHGILPQTPIENVELLLKIIRNQ
ncbi:MAG: uroporphyrinogen decarboxylase [Alphaproteobacteria bacterium]|nr:uroporphyrinogen decarboxylase [Alphaproteobacteria bacterium]